MKRLALLILFLPLSLWGQWTVSGLTQGVAGVTLSLISGADNWKGTVLRTTTSNVNGYQFTNVANGTYTVLPSLTGYIFWGPYANVTVNNANATVANLIPIIVGSSNWTMNGRILGNQISGIAIAVTDFLSGAAITTATSDLSGFYTVVLPNGNYTFTPSLTNFTFAPTSSFVGVYGYQVPAPNFTALLNQPIVYNITGNITGSAQFGVQMALSGTATGKTASTATGNYGFANLLPGTYTVTPTLQGFTFSPVATTVVISTASVSGVSFQATATTGGAGAGTELSVACICPTTVVGGSIARVSTTRTIPQKTVQKKQPKASTFKPAKPQ